MIVHSWTVVLIFMAIGLCLIEAGLYLYRKRRYSQAYAMLCRAKEETQDVVQLAFNNPHPLIQIDHNGVIVFVNAVALELFPNIKTRESQHPILKGVVREEMREIDYNKRVYHQTITATTLDNTPSFIIYCYDITAQKNTERALQQAYSDTEAARLAAEKAKDMRGEFLANMSHELRTPMNGIIGLSGILAELGLEADKQKIIESVHNSSQNLLILLNDILDFSKIEAGELNIESLPVDMRSIVHDTISLHNFTASQKGLILNHHVADHVPEGIMGDPSRLQQVINNLVSNALKFTKEGSVTIAIDGSYEQVDQFVMDISVRDTGIGIAKDEQARIFEKFQQADHSTAREYGGTGLGLAITQHLVDLMSGRVTLDSHENVGATFTITLPCVPCRLDNKQDRNQRINSIKVNTHAHIMIVDDHPVNLMYLRELFKKLGFSNVKEAGSGEQALSLYRSQPFDLIFMDCQMSDMDGFETVEKMRGKNGTKQGDTIIVAVTANAMKGARESCINAGMDDYMSKPIEKEKFYALLQKYVPGVDDIRVKNAPITPEKLADTLVIDMERLDGFTDGDPAIKQEIIEIFVQNLNKDIQNLQIAYDEKKYQDWGGYVHKIYGSCSHMGAHAMANVCSEGQKLIPEEMNKIPQCHQSVLREYERVKSVLKNQKQL